MDAISHHKMIVVVVVIVLVIAEEGSPRPGRRDHKVRKLSTGAISLAKQPGGPHPGKLRPGARGFSGAEHGLHRHTAGNPGPGAGRGAAAVAANARHVPAASKLGGIAGPVSFAVNGNRVELGGVASVRAVALDERGVLDDGGKAGLPAAAHDVIAALELECRAAQRLCLRVGLEAGDGVGDGIKEDVPVKASRIQLALEIGAGGLKPKVIVASIAVADHAGVVVGKCVEVGALHRCCNCVLQHTEVWKFWWFVFVIEWLHVEVIVLGFILAVVAEWGPMG
mmetsp:Transcript_18535/g.51750  ORF Transcript_18535/g.51750 Transcript_18535/m.51750 type:complete len:281 (+) Transcript_18535:328-1170(+)